ncbi:MAG: sigma-54 dependent transcriptional regulator, partial [Rhodospirillales bacterium]|nr:sigma-54 dependent transcriptional regulator [Rhodospirillales bacterium]
MVNLPIILVVDDEVRSLEALRRVLGEDFHVLTATHAGEAEALLEAEMVHVILCDQRMPGQHGIAFLKTVRDRWPDPVRMIISGYTDSEDIIRGVNEAGIFQYITKPWEPDELIRVVRDAVRLYALQRENESASIEMKLTASTLEQVVARKKVALKAHHHFDRILHHPDSPLRQAADLARRIAQYDISVLITGESGTGKELLARAIHYNSTRADKPFVVENCGALPDQLLESELFGCKKGAFTGAYEDRIGLFEQANGGTIFLDEVGETSPAFQVKLLRVLQEGEIRPLGARLTRKIDVRVIAATNRNLEEDVEAQRFRRDLFYRLAAFPIHLPPLRVRPMDIPLLAR